MAQHGTAWYDMAWYGTVRYGTVWYGTWHGTAWYGNVWYSTARYDIPGSTAWYGMLYGRASYSTYHGASYGMLTLDTPPAQNQHKQQSSLPSHLNVLDSAVDHVSVSHVHEQNDAHQGPVLHQSVTALPRTQEPLKLLPPNTRSLNSHSSRIVCSRHGVTRAQRHKTR